MSFINKNANIILLFLIIIATLCLVGATVFYQKNFEKINVRYNEKLAELQNITSELVQKQTALNETQATLALKSEREEVFTEKYTEVEEEKETLESENEELEGEVSTLSANLETAEAELETIRGELVVERTRTAQLTGQVEDLQSEVSDLEDDVDYWQDKYTAGNCTG
jgi:chromosome segregation ATPase